MKYLHQKLLLLLLSLLTTLPGFAGYDYDIYYYDIFFNITSGNTVAVTSYYYGMYSGDITIPKTIQYNGQTYLVTSIEENAFHQCADLTSVTLPNSLTTIGSDAFGGCSGLTSVTLPNSLTTIGSGAFRGCSGLTSVTIPNSVTTIGPGAFGDCSALAKFEVDLDNSAYCAIDGVLFNKNQTTLIQYPPKKSTTKYAIPNSVTYVEYNAFVDCDNLRSVTVPNSVTSFGRQVFMLCDNLMYINIPNSVSVITDNMFACCFSLHSVSLPNTITSVGIGAFFCCTTLADIYCAAEIPPTCKASGVPATSTLHVPAAAIEAYRNADGWKTLTNIEPFDFSDFELPELPEIPEESQEPSWQDAVTIEEEYSQSLFVPYVWASSDETVALVSQSGEVTAVAPGTCSVTLTWDDKVATCEVTVTRKSTGVAEISSVSPMVVYDLQGRRVASPRQGIFIVNGKATRL